MATIWFQDITETLIFNKSNEITQAKLNDFYKKWENEIEGFKPVSINESNEIVFDFDTIEWMEDDRIAPFILQGIENGEGIHWGSTFQEDFMFNEEISKFTNQLLLLFGENAEFYFHFAVSDCYGNWEYVGITITANQKSDLPSVKVNWDFEAVEDDEDCPFNNDEEEDDEDCPFNNDDSVQSENIEPKETGLLTKEQIKEFTEQEKEADDSFDYRHLADSIADENYLGDKEWARKLYKKAEDLAKDSGDYKYLANSIADERYLGDEELARKLYKQAEDLAENCDAYKYLANSIADEDSLGDKDWAREVYKKAEDLAEDFWDYVGLAGYVTAENKLGDKEWARKLYKKAEDLAKDSGDYLFLADSIADEYSLGDKDWAREVYKKAEDLAENSSDYRDLAESIADENYLGDKEWAREILENDL